MFPYDDGRRRHGQEDEESARGGGDSRGGSSHQGKNRDAKGDVFECQLVGPIEGDPTNGRVSIAAPIGAALIGRQRGARIEVATPRGSVTLEVLGVAASARMAKAA